MEQHESPRARMDVAATPVIEDPNLPSMEPLPAEDDDEGPALGVMPDPPDAVRGETNGDAPPDEEYPDMIPATGGADVDAGAASFAARADEEGYVRLLIEVDRRGMHVVDASIIHGSLVEPELTGAMAYEVMVGDRRVGAGAFDDLTEQHGYAPPDEETPGHRVGEISSFQFTARIPRSELTQDDLASLRIVLVRPETTTQLSEDIAPPPGISFEAAASEAGLEEPAVVASLEGIDLSELPSDAAEALQRGLR